MNEIDAYRETVQRGGKRRKNERRKTTAVKSGPRFFDQVFVVNLLILVLFGILIFYVN